MNGKAALSFLTVLAAFIVLIAWVRERATTLDFANAALQRKVEELERERAQEKSLLAANMASAGLNRNDRLELMRLRNEITQLRASNQALSRLEAENARLVAELRNLRAQSSSSDRQPSIERSRWSFQGYATPEAAYMSAMWALREGQIDTVLASFTPEERQRFETDNQGKSPEEITDRLKNQLGSVSALRVAGQRQVSPTEVVLETQMDTPSNNSLRRYAVPQAVRIRLVGNEWKAADPIDRISYDPLAFYRKNPELMKRYFPHLFKEGAPQEQNLGAHAIAERYGLRPAVPAEQPP